MVQLFDINISLHTVYLMYLNMFFLLFSGTEIRNISIEHQSLSCICIINKKENTKPIHRQSQGYMYFFT